MEDKDFLEAMSNHFRVHDSDDYIELETWTEGGVNMFVILDKETAKSYLEQYREYVLCFDVDEQIDLHREDKRYRNNFTVSESLRDFEVYEGHLKSILHSLDKEN